MGFFTTLNKKIKRNMLDLEINSLLNTFTKVSLKIPLQKKQNLFQNQKHYPIVFGYFLGAMLYIKEEKKFDNRHLEKILKSYLSSNFTNTDVSHAKELSKLIFDLSRTEEGKEYMQVGRQAYKKWLNEKSDVIADLNRLLIEVEGK